MSFAANLGRDRAAPTRTPPPREYRDVTPLSPGKRFEVRMLVSEPAMGHVAERGGRS